MTKILAASRRGKGLTAQAAAQATSKSILLIDSMVAVHFSILATSPPPSFSLSVASFLWIFLTSNDLPFFAARRSPMISAPAF